jgi:chromosome partitioning protein
MKVITLLNECGGVGKTTLATHIAAGLALRGLRVVLVDADAQGTATLAMGHAYEPGLYDLLVRGAEFSDVLRAVNRDVYAPPGTTPAGKLALVPSNIETRSIPINISDTFVVVDRLEELEGMWDVVVFDTSPTPNLLHGSIYLATNGIIYPTKPEFNSIAGLVNSLNHRALHQGDRERRGLPPLKVLGIVPTMHRAKTAAHVAALRDIEEQFSGSIWPALALRTTWVEAALEGKLVYAYEPNSAASKDMAKVLTACMQSLHEAWYEKSE